MDGLSFGAGLLTGILGFWLALKLHAHYKHSRADIRTYTEQKKQRKSSSAEARFTNEVILHAQGLHLAASLFPLDEILIPPRLLAQQPIEIDDEQDFQQDITDTTIPYMPDWPELASYYGAPTLSLAEMLQGGANLIVTGQPGSGRSVCLAHLAIQVARHDPETGSLSNHLPLLLHAADLVLPSRNPKDLTRPLTDACVRYISPATASQLPRIVHSAFQSGRGLLLLDGLDELSGADTKQIIQYLADLLRQYPAMRVVLTALPDYLGSLPALGLIPVTLANWTKSQRQAFINMWSNQWNKHIASTIQSSPEVEGPALIESWLQSLDQICTPLAFTLTTWAAFCGDMLGPGLVNGLESYIRRALADPKAPTNIKLLLRRMEAAEDFALHLILSQNVTLDRKDAETKLAGVFSNLLSLRAGSRCSFQHSIITAYLAAKSLALQSNPLENIHQQPDWNGKLLTLQFMAIQDSHTNWIHRLTPDLKTDLVLRELLAAARWLADAPADVSWRSKILQQLAEFIRQEDLPGSLRMRILSAFVCSNSKGTNILLRRLLTHTNEEIVLAAALGSGFIKDEQAVSNLNQLLSDTSPAIVQSACLALAAIGTKSAIESIASALVSDSFDVQRSAAEALANNPQAGYSTLVEGSQFENIAVRRAVVYGLARIREPWAEQTLAKMHSDDEQWIVKNAAAQMLDTRNRPSQRLPRPLTIPSQTPWLLEFAARHGIGIVPGDPAWNLLFKTLQDGHEKEILSAMHYLSLKGGTDTVEPLYQTLFNSTGRPRNAAYNAIWLLAARGIAVPPPLSLWND